MEFRFVWGRRMMTENAEDLGKVFAKKGIALFIGGRNHRLRFYRFK